MSRNLPIGSWLTGMLLACALGAAHAQTLLPEQTAPELQLRLETQLGEVSRERLADGSAAAQPEPEPEPELKPVTAPAIEPAARTRPFSTLPALLLGAIVLALAAFAAGVYSVRRRPVVERTDSAPVQLWADPETLEQEVTALREQLAQQQELNESLQADRDAREQELLALRRQRDEAASESQILRMRGDDEELTQAHETIDELRIEIERLRGAETDLEHASDRLDEDGPEALQRRLHEREQHIQELEELMHGVRAERDVLEQSITGRDAQIQALEQTLDNRDEQIQLLSDELAAAQQQSGEVADERVRELAEELETVRRDAAREVERLQDRLNERHEAEERVEVLLGRNQQLESELDNRRDELIQLAEQNDKLKAHLRDLEFALKRDEDLTTRLELGSLQAGAAAAGTSEVPALSETLRQAQQRITQLQSELAAANEQLEQLGAGDPELATIRQQNVKLSAMVVQRDNMVAELEARLAQLSGDAGPEEWTSTVSSLENELRRKMTVIDSQADNLREGEEQLHELQSRVASLNEQLDASRDESDSLKALLAEAQAQAKTLREELDQFRHSRGDGQAGDRRGAPLGAGADLATLESAVNTRRELVGSLQSILDEESSALTTARERASDREDMLVALENEIAANRITIAALQNRVSHAREHGGVPPSGETQRLERELQRGVRIIEKLRTDLHKWRRRVRPLHEAVTMRDNRIRNLDAQLRALRDGGPGHFVLPAAGTEGASDASRLDEKTQYFQILTELNADAERLENELAETGLELSRVCAADESRIAEIENLESARVAQAMRMDELHHELATLGIDPAAPGDSGNVVELQARRPST